MQLFATHLQPSQRRTPSARASQYRRSRRRARDADDIDDLSGSSTDDDAKSQLRRSTTQSRSSFASPEADEVRAAGLSTRDASEIPPPPFPHAPGGTSKQKFSLSKLQKELNSLDPPLYAATATSKSVPLGRPDERPALRQKHLGVLTTVLHRYLLEGDYQRAGRAWGLLLRTHIRGLASDPRTLGRWGIGAELLMHQTMQNSPHQDQVGDDEDLSGKSLYTEEGFEFAREYYERLIIQYPNLRLHPHSVDDRTFYPAMFSLWIYEVNEKSKRARQRLEKEREREANATMQSDEDTWMTSPEDDHAQDLIIMDEELRRAKEIASRLDQIIVSPPFDKQADLLQIRGMVGFWLGDLILRLKEPNSRDGGGTGPQESEEYHATGTTAEMLTALLDSRREFEKARTFLERARSKGPHIQDSIASVEEKISHISKMISKFNV